MLKRMVFLLAVSLILLSATGAVGTDFYYLTVGNNLGDSGSTSPNGSTGYAGETHPAFQTYAMQDVYAFAPDGYMFSNWTGDVPAGMETQTTVSVVMDRNRTITANFSAVTHRVITTRGYIHASPLLYDINHDNHKEIIVGDMAGYVYCFSDQGVKLWEYYAGDAFNSSLFPVPAWFNPEVHAKYAAHDVGNVTIQSSCAAGDVDADSFPEIVCGVGGFAPDADPSTAGGTTVGWGPNGQGGILVLDANGNLKLLVRSVDSFGGPPGALQDGYSDGVISSPAIADMNGDGRLDFAVGGLDQSIYAFQTTDYDSSMGGKRSPFNYPSNSGLYAAPIFERDDDGDGLFNEDPMGECTPMTPYADPSTLRPGFPGVDDDGDGLVDEGMWSDDDEDATSPSCPSCVDWNLVDEDEFEWPFRNTDTVVSSPALADLTGNGAVDLIIGVDSSGATPPNGTGLPTGGGLRVLTNEAQEVGAFPQAIEQVVWSSPGVVDIDGDGEKEIFVGTGTMFCETANMACGQGDVWKGRALYAYNADGSPYRTGTTPSGVFATTDSAVFAAPAFGDIDGNGSIDVVVMDFNAKVYAWNASGALLPGFPMLPLAVGSIPGASNPQTRSSPILADVDGDGLPEIVATMGLSIVAVNGDGTMVPAFNYAYGFFTTGSVIISATPAAADLDNNGKLDLVWVTGHSSDGTLTNVDYGEIHVWEMGDYTPVANPWPMFKRTGTRTSVFDLVVENPSFSPLLSALAGGGNLAVAVDVVPGKAPITDVRFFMDVNGATLQAILLDDGSQEDAVAGDGRFAGRIVLPSTLTTAGNLRFVAQDGAANVVEFKVAYSFEALKIRNLVREYYGRVLDRTPDQAGEDFWTAQIQRIAADGIDIKEGFIALAKFFFESAEYVGTGKSDTAYVTDLYQTFLGRDPDPGGLAFWLDYLSQGLSRGMLLNNFAYSAEFMLYMENMFGPNATRAEYNLVNDFYRGLLNRLPDSGGFNGWAGMMQNAQCTGAQAVRDTASQEALAFVRSAEYAGRGRTNAQFVEDLYNAFLRRGADAAGFLQWVDMLDTRVHTRESLLAQFVNSAEFQFRVTDVIDEGCIP